MHKSYILILKKSKWKLHGHVFSYTFIKNNTVAWIERATNIVFCGSGHSHHYRMQWAVRSPFPIREDVTGPIWAYLDWIYYMVWTIQIPIKTLHSLLNCLSNNIIHCSSNTNYPMNNFRWLYTLTWTNSNSKWIL